MPGSAAEPVKSGGYLLGDGDAYILALPPRFSFAEALRSARKIRVATAFARLSGWQHFREPVSKGAASVSLLTGLDCWHTQPELLREWHELTMASPDRVEARAAPDDLFFHPKVLIVTSDKQPGDFAIVGSGNLSEGGLRSNVECGVYLTDRRTIVPLIYWFDRQFERGKRLSDKGIAAYARSYKPNAKVRRRLEEKQNALQKTIGKSAEEIMREWDRAVHEAKAFFTNYGTERQKQDHAKAEELRSALKWSANFSFDRSGLDDFFAGRFLGHLQERQKTKVWRHQKRLKKALRALIADPVTTLPNVLEPSGSLKVPV